VSASLIRPATLEDVPSIASLRRRVFCHSEQPDEESLARYLKLVLFGNPWVDPDLPSLAVESAEGGIVGFMGRIVRPYRLGGRALRGAVATEVMIDPALRGRGLGSRLMRTYLGGGQDFTVADRANDGYRRLCEACGGEVTAWYSWYWTVPLRPSRFGIAQLGWRGAGRITSPLTSALDAVATRMAPGRFRKRRPLGVIEELDATAISALLPRCSGAESMYPVYDADALRWLLERLSERLARSYRTVDQSAVRIEPHGVVGWFICADREDGVSDTVQLAAEPEYRDLVFAHLVFRAWQRGAVAVTGRFDPLFTEVMVRERVSCTLAQPWVVVHSQDALVAAAFRAGHVFFSRLEAEWWLAT
jgi:GNAT superfamily N-acetyltransferase